MTDAIPLFQYLQHYSLVVGLVCFVAIAVWAYWPGNKRAMEEHGRAILRDDE